MAEHIDGPLYYERMGTHRAGDGIRASQPDGPVVLDLPDGADVDLVPLHRDRRAGLRPLAQGARRADHERHGAGLLGGDRRAIAGEQAILVGCSVGSAIITHMHHLRPSKTSALILSGTGYNPARNSSHARIEDYKEYGIDYRWHYTFDDLSPAFRATPLAHFFADMFAERNRVGDIDIDHPPVRGARRPTPRIITRESPAPPSSSPAARTTRTRTPSPCRSASRTAS